MTTRVIEKLATSVTFSSIVPVEWGQTVTVTLTVTDADSGTVLQSPTAATRLTANTTAAAAAAGDRKSVV